MNPKRRPTVLTLWALCDSRTERIELGRATHVASSPREPLMSCVLTHFMFWGDWKQTRVRVVTDGERGLEVFRDVTDDAITSFMIKYPHDEVAKRVFKRSAAPEIVVGRENVVVVENWGELDHDDDR